MQPSLLRSGQIDGARRQTQRQRPKQPAPGRQQQPEQPECSLVSGEDGTQDKRGSTPVAAESRGFQGGTRNDVPNSDVRRLQSFLQLPRELGDAVRDYVSATEHAERVPAAGALPEQRDSSAADVPTFWPDAESTVGAG